MIDSLGQLLGSGVGVALSPIPIIAVILMLGTPRARSNGLAFALGWVIGLTAATTIVLVLASGADESGSTAADGVHISSLVIGALFLALAVRQWQQRPKAGAAPELPAWMAGIDGFSGAKSFGLGAALSGVNPKNLALAVSAATALAASGATTGGNVAGVALFVLVGSLSVAGPVLGFLAARGRVEPLLAGAKQWMVANNSTIMIVLFSLLGATKLGDGIASLAN